MNIETKLKDLNIVLPVVNPPLAAYIPAVRSGNLVFTAGQLPIKEGQVAYTGKLRAK